MKLSDWIRSKISHKGALASGQTNNPGRSPLLDLPGEIRNQIYSYVIYPSTEVPIIVNCNKPKHLGNSIFKPAIFRVSRQVRAEALSYLCATKTIEAIGIVSAIAFFKAVGEAVKEIKDLVVLLLDSIATKKGWERVLELFGWLDEMKGLKNVFVGRLEPERKWGEMHSARAVVFHGRVRSLEQRGVAVTVRVDLGQEGFERQLST